MSQRRSSCVPRSRSRWIWSWWLRSLDLMHDGNVPALLTAVLAHDVACPPGSLHEPEAGRRLDHDVIPQDDAAAEFRGLDLSKGFNHHGGSAPVIAPA